MRFPRVRLPLPISTLRQPLRRYSAGISTPQSTKPRASVVGASSRFWASVREAPVNPDREQGPKGLVFPSINEKTIPYFWLRDSCRCSTCVNQATRQRNFDTFELPDDIRPSRWTANESGLEIQWSHDSHVSFYTRDFLEPYIKGDRPEPEDLPLEYFGAEGHRGSTIEYGEFVKNETRAVGRLTDTIRRKGFALVTGVPTEPVETTKDLLEMIAPIRQTHYGGFYVFTPDLGVADTAYTNEALPSHEPSGIQCFHLLSHEGVGGESTLVDGFYAAQILREESLDSFNTLANLRLSCHASGNEGIAISPDKLYPVLELDSNQNAVHRIRWNKSDRAVLPLPGNEMEWYKAARKFDEILRRKELVYQFQLKPGTVLLFDNWRVLHGRTEFTGKRKICGGYLTAHPVSRDDFISRWRYTNYEKREVLKQVIGE
ncbi:hypothetical protein EKO27_g6338 [Xylaria grammica]|uniref:Trimethyllysine dioxygenase n=1 Tax=Xylaria grammica TaxID=363999 RepID=A0A439D2U0_9PEZI|nr:hypothetical protein EKO27_g6338 [Xylaria grammica]